MLSGLETRKEKVMHVILVGQPALSDVLDTPEMEQLVQRVRLRYHIKSLSEHDTRDYILHRLRIAGAESPEKIFVPDTYAVIYKYTGGLPRLINTLCDTAMTCAFADNLHTVSVDVLNTAIDELQWLPYAKRINKRRTEISTQTGASEPQAMLRDNTKALTNIGNQLNRLDALEPALSSLSTKVTNIESLLKRIAEALESVPPNVESIRRKQIGQDK